MSCRLDMTNPAVQEAVDKLTSSCRTMTGTNFALLMSEEGDGGTVFTVHNRPSQPCQGGEMRKYSYTMTYEKETRSYKKEPLHTNCTRPDDPRPTDLRMPFPNGTPEAVGVHLNGSYGNPGIKSTPENIQKYNEYVHLVYGPDSMYGEALNYETISFVTHPETGLIQGLIFFDTEVDSTVLVNSLQFFRSKQQYHTSGLLKLRDLGFSDREALIILMLNSGFSPTMNGVIPINPTGTYYFSMQASLRRLIEGDPNDLTGGTFRDGFDYNRPYIQDLFKANGDEIGLNWKNEFEALYRTKFGKSTSTAAGYNFAYNVTPEQFVEVTKEIFQKFYYENNGLKEAKKEAA